MSEDSKRTLDDVMFGESDRMLFVTPHDVHLETAAEMFGVRPEEVTKDMREEAKRRNFGKLYGMSAEKIQALGPPLTEGEARARLTEMFLPSPPTLAGDNRRSKRPKCPRCWNKQPAKRSCGYCGGQGRV